MFNNHHYVPILKWKQGEYQALFRLADHVKDRITPLIEIPPIGFDHETQEPSSSIDTHLASFGARLKAKWQSRRCFVDLRLLGFDAAMANGQSCVGYILARARANQCSVVPVVSLDCPAAFVSAVAAAITLDGRGACIRISATDFDRVNLVADIDGLLSLLNISWTDADLIIDLESFPYPSNTVFVHAADGMLSMLPHLNQWRTLTVAGTSYPALVSQVVNQQGSPIIRRREWIAYRSLANHLGTNARIPTFGDYAAAHPDIVEMDMRVVKPFAKLRYTIDDAWYIALGTNVRTNGFSQYRQLCATLVASPYFSGGYFSAGDNYIDGCANGTEPTGNLTTWVWVATNRHLTKVVSDLATQFGP